jgi:hypothetical protein
MPSPSSHAESGAPSKPSERGCVSGTVVESGDGRGAGLSEQPDLSHGARTGSGEGSGTRSGWDGFVTGCAGGFERWESAGIVT